MMVEVEDVVQILTYLVIERTVHVNISSMCMTGQYSKKIFVWDVIIFSATKQRLPIDSVLNIERVDMKVSIAFDDKKMIM